MTNFADYLSRAKEIYRAAFANPSDDKNLVDLKNLSLRMREEGVSSDRISLLLRSAMNEVQKELSND